MINDVKLIKTGIMQNPYKNAPTTKRYANMHCHAFAPHAGWDKINDVIDYYHSIGFDILGISPHHVKRDAYKDIHDSVPWPWSNLSNIQDGAENRDENALGMVAVPATEIEYPNHIGSYFSNFQKTTKSHHEVFQGITDMGGLCQYNHPKILDYVDVTNRELGYYLKRYPALIGVEITNKREDYLSGELESLWDDLLDRLMPYERNVFGLSNDDSHGQSQVADSWMVVFNEEFTLEGVKESMENGWFYGLFPIEKNKGPLAENYPEIDEIKEVDNKTLKVVGKHIDKIEWLTNGGKVISTSDTVNLRQADKYVRLKIKNQYGHAISNAVGYGKINLI